MPLAVPQVLHDLRYSRLGYNALGSVLLPGGEGILNNFKFIKVSDEAASHFMSYLYEEFLEVASSPGYDPDVGGGMDVTDEPVISILGHRNRVDEYRKNPGLFIRYTVMGISHETIHYVIMWRICWNGKQMEKGAFTTSRALDNPVFGIEEAWWLPGGVNECGMNIKNLEQWVEASKANRASPNNKR